MSEVVKALLRFALEIAFRILFSVPGWIAAHVFRLHGKVHADGCFVFICGFLFWSPDAEEAKTSISRQQPGNAAQIRHCWLEIRA